MHARILTLTAALAASASAATVRIDVGQNGFTFSPSSVTASKGDTLEYHFHQPAHSVASSDFGGPCTPSKSGGFYSGVMTTSGAAENANVFRVVVNSTDPIFFYCTVPGHCNGGMSGVVNPSGSQTLAAYQSSAQTASLVVPPNVFGGQVASGSSSSSNGGSTSSSSSTTGSATTSPTNTPTGSSSGGGGGLYGSTPGSGAASLTASAAVVLGALGAVVFMY